MKSLDAVQITAFGGTINLMPNPGGELGVAGFLTTTAGTTLVVEDQPDQPGETWVKYACVNLARNFFETDNFPVTPGKYFQAGCRVAVSTAFETGWVQMTYLWMKADGVTGNGTVSGSAGNDMVYMGANGLNGALGYTYEDTHTTPTKYLSGGSKSALVPANTAFVRVRWEFLSGVTTGNPRVLTPRGSAGASMWVGNVWAIQTDSASPQYFNGVVDDPATDVTGDLASVKISRSALNVGTMSLQVKSTTETKAALVPGRKVTAAARTGAVYPMLYTGTILNVVETYVPDARLEVTCTDNISVLASRAENRGMATFSDMNFTMEGKGVPWRINGAYGQHIASASVVSYNQSASILDQIAITRDSVGGYAWVDAKNVLQMYDSGSLPSTIAYTFSETVYSTIDISYNTEDCINEVKIVWLRYDPATGETNEIVYGPYQDLISQRKWGTHDVEFKMHGASENGTTIAAKAATILTKNATPAIRVNSVTIPIRTPTDIPAATLDLYKSAHVNFAGTSTSEDSWITSVTHDITPEKWKVTYGFSMRGLVASPQVTPSAGARRHS